MLIDGLSIREIDHVPPTRVVDFPTSNGVAAFAIRSVTALDGNPISRGFGHLKPPYLD
jgi:hypothetical protein